MTTRKLTLNAETQALAQSLAEQIGRMSDSEAEGPEAAAIRRRLIDLVGQTQADELTLAASNAAGLAVTAAARALGSISTPRKAKSSAANGRRGGRIPTTVHVTRIGPAGEVYGHATRHCDESVCSGTERYLGQIVGAERGHVYELAGRRIVAEIV